MPWIRETFDNVKLENITRAEFDATWAPHMELWQQTEVPEGAPYYRLSALRLHGNAEQFDVALAARQRATWLTRQAGRVVVDAAGIDVPCQIHVYCVRTGGAPDPGVSVVQYWMGDRALLDVELPLGGLPPAGLDPHGNSQFANAAGMCEWTWGSGEGFDPITMRGAHSYWVSCDEGGQPRGSDVAVGFGWRWGTDHTHLDPVWERVEAGQVEPPEEPGDVAAAINRLADVLAAGIEVRLRRG